MSIKYPLITIMLFFVLCFNSTTLTHHPNCLEGTQSQLQKKHECLQQGNQYQCHNHVDTGLVLFPLRDGLVGQVSLERMEDVEAEEDQGVQHGQQGHDSVPEAGPHAQDCHHGQDVDDGQQGYLGPVLPDEVRVHQRADEVASHEVYRFQVEARQAEAGFGQQRTAVGFRVQGVDQWVVAQAEYQQHEQNYHTKNYVYLV